MKLYLIGLCMLIVYLHECNAVLNPKVVCYYESWGKKLAKYWLSVIKINMH